MAQKVPQQENMKLLIVTQAVDKNDPILGFFHRWVEEFAKHFEHIHVIALQVGEHNLPKNVTIHSLGKEKDVDRFQQLITLYSSLITLHKNYDAVFVHMNPEYIVLAGWLWRLTGKKIGLWYNHTVGSFWLRMAHPFTTRIFHTSPYAYTARYKNAQRMPAGIDTDVFKPHPEVTKVSKSIYFQGRIAPAKRVHIILDAFAELHGKGEANLLTLVGPENEAYTKPLRARYIALIESSAVVFKGPIPNTETPELYAAHEVSVNLTDDGNYDKTVLESMACGTPAVVSSDAFSDIVPDTLMLKDVSTASLARVLEHALSASYNPDSLRAPVVQKHSLPLLAKKLSEVIAS